ncbi:hypothetical protein BU16DRAFT_539735 [Lophium mytilinum]|uniref:Uncharacterized protein n=1 Tax=Lophium mytilinum TaxID=390894 RepID=A0A6A6QPK5_9PEZI|nr:hypothetical protein BU16DRAFT_539735 [Lophium mytilinum]
MKIYFVLITALFSACAFGLPGDGKRWNAKKRYTQNQPPHHDPTSHWPRKRMDDTLKNNVYYLADCIPGGSVIAYYGDIDWSQKGVYPDCFGFPKDSPQWGNDTQIGAAAGDRHITIPPWKWVWDSAKVGTQAGDLHDEFGGQKGDWQCYQDNKRLLAKGALKRIAASCASHLGSSASGESFHLIGYLFSRSFVAS